MANTTMQTRYLLAIGSIVAIFVVITCRDQLVAQARRADIVSWKVRKETTSKIRKEKQKKLNDVIVDPARKFRYNSVIYISNATMVQPDQPWMQEGTQAFEKCSNLDPSMKCSFNSSHESLLKSDAVLIHGRHFEMEDFIPERRPLYQKWVFLETEPPPKMWDRVKHDMEVWKTFNITMGYSKDADILHNMYSVKCEEKEDWVPSGINYAENKTKMVAWLVSDCKTDSRREVYVDELKKYIDIDIFGKCGMDSNCGRYPAGQECVNALLEDNYKFYLAFENAFCDEYITEKFAKTLDLNIIPVVMGLAQYSDVIQEETFIHAHDFKSPKDLAEFMKNVAADDKAYNSYIENKFKMQCHYVDRTLLPCKLCEYLHRHMGTKQLAPDARKFWGLMERCQSPKEVYSRIAPEVVPNLTPPNAYVKLGLQ